MRAAMKSAVAAAFAFAVAIGCAKDARAVIVERVVAVVGDRPILLSELLHRAHPFLYRIYASSQNQAQVAAAKTEMEKELLTKMIEYRLEETAADKAHLNVSADEVDNALRNVSNSAHLTLPQLIEEARKTGLSEQDYREEIRRQIIEGKLIQLRVRGRVRVTDQDAHSAFQRYVLELESQHPVNLRILAKRLPAGAGIDQIKDLTKLANRLVAEARQGADFCALVKKYSDDTQTKTTCGSRGDQPQSALVPEIQAAVEGLKIGDTAEPIPVGTEAILVVQVGPPETPQFDTVKDQMWERAYGEAMEHQRKLWLDELRRGVYVDVRL
jgi:peptidyl-prolyl cis-trans isomerase SurA